MEDLTKIQIRESCRLALPEGLQDLMSDISREVLRAQPKNLLQFITKYLGALLVTRENLTAAAAVCDDVCDNMCAAGLDDELRYRGIEEEHIKVIEEIVDEYLKKTGSGKLVVKEGDLIAKIMRKTSVAANQIFDIKEAVRTAFLRQQAYNTTIFELSPDGSMDSIARATQHTLDLYRKSKPSDEEYHRAALKIETAYRAFGVRRQKLTEKSKAVDWRYSREIINRVEVDSSIETDDDIADVQCKHISFSDEPDRHYIDTENHLDDTHSVATNASEKTEVIKNYYPNRMITVSSTSLAGSYMTLPKNKPYNPYDEEPISETDEHGVEETEKQKDEHFNVDYTKETSITINEPIAPYLFDGEPDDSDSSVEEEVQESRKVVIDSNIDLLPDGYENEGDDDVVIDEELDQLAEDIDKLTKEYQNA
ncbi:hypothetical protein O0L34_g15297 [Tuta absoluta]|nr:hypothetical protein O0L34_g15297 [Tuta absoluta]